ncbi:MAG: MBL fold metallo-hydrolase [Bryobacteraceae bacterium]|nr:MBL fold metallo-hydrolase [Bryobacteraceae bacterium]
MHCDQRETDYWLCETNATGVSELQKKLFGEAILKVKPYVEAGKVQTFNGATRLFPGLSTQPAYGHTPGHTFYVLESKGEKLVFWGDVLHVTEVQFPKPSITIAFDMDQSSAARTRGKAFAQAAEEGYLVAPAHTSFPGIGHVVRDGDGFRWLPAPYVNDAIVKPVASPALQSSGKQ